jgi:hypothetical protein
MAPVGSFLAVDFGNVHTRALLIDLVEGGYTVIAQAQEPTTAGFPNQDIGVGLARAIRQLSQFTGRTLTGSEGKVIQPEQADGSGVGAFIATSSIGRPLRTLIVGLMPDYSVASALRAAAGTYVDIVGIVSLDQALNTEDMLNRIVLARPDLIFVSGGTDGGAEGAVMELAAVVRLAVQLMSGRPPQVLFAGNSALHARLNALFEGTALIVTTANILPSLQAERLEEAQLELGLAFNTFAGLRGAGCPTRRATPWSRSISAGCLHRSRGCWWSISALRPASCQPLPTGTFRPASAPTSGWAPARAACSTALASRRCGAGCPSSTATTRCWTTS